jgi:hypothetical protein
VCSVKQAQRFFRAVVVVVGRRRRTCGERALEKIRDETHHTDSLDVCGNKVVVELASPKSSLYSDKKANAVMENSIITQTQAQAKIKNSPRRLVSLARHSSRLKPSVSSSTEALR